MRNPTKLRNTSSPFIKVRSKSSSTRENPTKGIKKTLRWS